LRRRIRWRGGVFLLLAVFLTSCSVLPFDFYSRTAASLERADRVGVIGDDLDVESLLAAASASLRYYGDSGRRKRYSLGHDTYSSRQLRRSVEHFVELVRHTPTALLHQRLANECRAYAPHQGARFTAYYEPVLEARSSRDEKFRYPVYGRPDELTRVELGRFFKGDARLIHGRVKDGDLVPYLTREDIDGSRLLEGRDLELAWVDDPVALYFLHVQGSGRLRMEDGRVMRVNFAASNGLSYFSVGRWMLDNRVLGPGQGSSSAIRSWLTLNPEQREGVLFRNPRYIFFRQVELADNQGPMGALGVPLIGGRSIATDPSFVPPGALTYIISRRPELNDKGQVVSWRHFARFAFNHDTGGAIKGPGRADIYWGEGEKQGLEAGYMNEPGRMAVLLCGVQPQPASPTRQAAVNELGQVNWPFFEPVSPTVVASAG